VINVSKGWYNLKIEYGEKYKNSNKNIKNRYNEKKTLDMIINHIKQCTDFPSLSINPISLMYGFEPLKHELNGYYSFNLNKNGGKIRLIVSPSGEEILKLEYISIDHYEDFKNKL
jgi:Txe/YoeB family toxin of Txe-Axe toxin-antitoxin module